MAAECECGVDVCSWLVLQCCCMQLWAEASKQSFMFTLLQPGDSLTAGACCGQCCTSDAVVMFVLYHVRTAAAAAVLPVFPPPRSYSMMPPG